MPLLSKVAYFLGLPILNTNCYETFHTWSPNCNRAVLDALPDGILFCLKCYAPLYLVTALISNRGDFRKIEFVRYLRDVIRSSVFLTCNLALFLFFVCRIRRMLGFFTPISMGLVSGMLSSFLSLLIEKRSRWSSLALHLTNLASETLFRHLNNHGYVCKVKRGEVIPFMIGVGVFSYFHSTGKLDESTRKAFNFIFHTAGLKDILLEFPLPSKCNLVLRELRSKFGRSENCEHRHSCVSVTLESFLYNYAIGLSVSVGLRIFRNIAILMSSPTGIMQQLFSWSTLRTPTFFSLLPFIFHSTRCLLSRFDKISIIARNVTAGIISGLALLTFPNVSISMLIMWKAIEMLYRNLVEQGYIKPLPYGDLFLYTVSTGYVLWKVVIEPQAIRKSYLNFLLAFTGRRISLLNRHLFDHFGYQSSVLFDHHPVLNNKYVTINPKLYQPVRAPH